MGIQAPDSIPIIREELCDRLEAEVSVATPAREEIAHGLARGRPT